MSNDIQPTSQETDASTSLAGVDHVGASARPPAPLNIDLIARRGDTPAAPNVLRILHHAFRGHYMVMTAMSLVAAGLAIFAAMRIAKPVYHSEGLIRIAYTLPQVMEETDKNQPKPMFDTFMLSQQLLITSRRVLDQAIQDPIWKARGVQVPSDPEHYFSSNLKVEVKTRSEFIRVLVNDSDPATAAAAVTSIINAYSELYSTQEKQLERQRLGVLEDRQNALQTQIDRLNSQIQTAAQEYGTTNLDSFYDAAALRVTKLETTLSDVRMAMARGALGSADADPSTRGSTQPTTRSVAELAAIDPAMKGYLDAQTRCENELRELIAAGYGDVHKRVIMARQALDAAKSRVAEYAAVLRTLEGNSGHALGAARNDSQSPKSIEALKETEISVGKLLNEARQQMVALGNKRLELKRLEDELHAVQEQQTHLARRMDALRAEGSLGGRLSVVSTGEIPLSPEKDRRLVAGVAGGLFGLCLPPVGFLLTSLAFRRRYRYSDDTADDSMIDVPLLGVLPSLTDARPGSDAAAGAAHSIHQLRVTLQSRSARRGPMILLVTSSAAGEGKTSVAMSLGLSFAAARQRTLVIDADFVGRRLSKNMKMLRREGLYEALAAGSLPRSVRKAAHKLYILGAGNVDAKDACAVSSAGARALFEHAREHFDIVLIDTGPILGSVEASVLAQEVDAVVFTVSRGQQRRVVESAMHRLRTLDARIAGFVFNRAENADFFRTSYRSGSLPEGAAAGVSQVLEGDKPAGGKFDRFGPLVQAIAGTLSLVEED